MCSGRFLGRLFLRVVVFTRCFYTKRKKIVPQTYGTSFQFAVALDRFRPQFLTSGAFSSIQWSTEIGGLVDFYMRIVGITGTLGAGKGALVEYLQTRHDFKWFSVRAFLLREIEKRGLTAVACAVSPEKRPVSR